jgi:hypothetical protein
MNGWNPAMPTGVWGKDGKWHDGLNPNSQSDQQWLQQNDPAAYDVWKQSADKKQQFMNDPNSPYNQALGLGSKEKMLLGREAPAISQVMNGGLMDARANQMSALGAQQQLMAGPSLAQMRGQQQFGQQRAMMGGAAGGNPLAARNAMLGGNQALGAMAGTLGSQVGQETLQSQRGIAGSANTLAQGDLQSQGQMEQLLQKQRQMYLAQRGQNLGQAQGYEQNYFNTQNAYTQSAQAAIAARFQKEQADKQQQLQLWGAAASAIPYVGGAAAAAGKGAAGA